MQFIIFAIIFIAEFLTTPLTVLFYDQPEYLRTVATHSFWQVFSLGHFPIHPVFMGLLWIGTKFISANLVALVFGIISTLLIYKISKLIFKNGRYWLAAVIFSLLPAVWIINTNLMVESVSLTFYILAIYLFLKKKNFGFVLSIFLMIGTHIESIFWIPTIFLIPFIFGIKLERSEVIKWIWRAVLSILAGIGLYALLYYFGHLGLGGSGEQLGAYFSSGPARMIRNIWLSFTRGFGTLTPFLLIYLLVRNIKSKKVFLAWTIFFAFVALIGANWQGDYMVRRLIFAAVILSLAIYKYMGKYSILFILYLAPVILANGLLYYRGNPNMPLIQMQERIDRLPPGQVLIESGYYSPFIKYNGTILWLEGGRLGEIDSDLKAGKRVFLEKNAVTAPYRLFVGNNFHITSLGRVGSSDSMVLFEKYSVVPYGEVLELKLFKGTISKEAGQPVINYDPGFWARLSRNRIDYGDIGTWAWALIVNHRDPTGWIFKDAGGIWLHVQNTNPL
jgi:hypothetical protein